MEKNTDAKPCAGGCDSVRAGVPKQVPHLASACHLTHAYSVAAIAHGHRARHVHRGAGDLLASVLDRARGVELIRLIDAVDQELA